MAQHPFLKSIQPVNLLSFGPDTPEIELRPLNILIGANGSGKSNLIEILGLLRNLPSKKPWSYVTETGGVREWVWRNATDKSSGGKPSISIHAASIYRPRTGDPCNKDFQYNIEFGAWSWKPTLEVVRESLLPFPKPDGEPQVIAEIWREDGNARFWDNGRDDVADLGLELPVTDQTSVFSVLPGGMHGAAPWIAFELERIKLYRNWVFGAEAPARGLEKVGKETNFLEEDISNLAHMLNSILTHQDPEPGRKLREAFASFSGDSKEEVEALIRIQEGFIQLRIRESSGISIPSNRLSDGTLRWLALLAILLNPSPASITCIEEPELGLHPDAIHTLADLLVEASTRTQLIVTTHSDALLDAFTETPEVVCVCEKVEGSTTIRRLDKERLKVWLKEYSLGHLWMSGEIGGNRW